jgi:hypothetical protein
MTIRFLDKAEIKHGNASLFSVINMSKRLKSCPSEKKEAKTGP